MDKFIVNQWEENKHLLESHFKSTPQSEYSSYKSIVELVFTLCTPRYNDYDTVDIDKMTVIDDGHYQGTEIFIIPSTTYQPGVNEYIVTHTHYGSCSGCDTLQGISGYSDELPSESQVKDYMTLALHIVQKAKRGLYEELRD